MAEEEKKKTKKMATTAGKEKKAKVAKPKAVKKPKVSKKKEEAPVVEAPVEVKETTVETVTPPVQEPVKAAAPAAVAAKPVKKVLKHDKKPSKKVQYHGVGGRKTSRARVWLTPGSGRFSVNGKALTVYTVNRPILLYQAVQPFMLTNTTNKYDVKANVFGGGIASQIGAVRQAIAKALLEINPDFRPPLRTTGMLTRDSRIKERKKYGRKKARKSFQFSKR